jgi:hypothetical protein
VIEALSVYRAAVASNPVKLIPSHPASLIPPKRPRCAVFEVLPVAADGGSTRVRSRCPGPFVAGDGGQLARLRDEQALADGLGSVANNVWCGPSALQDPSDDAAADALERPDGSTVSQ